MISTLGDPEGNGKGDFILIDGETLTVKGEFKAKRTCFGACSCCKFQELGLKEENWQNLDMIFGTNRILT